jgi:hypothetical protein
VKGQGLLDGLVLRLSLAKVATVFQQGFTAYLLAVAFFCGLGQQTVTHVRFATMLSVPAACCPFWLLQGPSGGVCLKQSLPFVRCVGEGWPLSQDRCRIEAEALMLEYKLCPEHTPEVRGQRPEGGGFTSASLGAHYCGALSCAVWI